ncbi:Predicted arabinose efflux permease, MFS family [Amycolatopsis arida]|uniref:Predicted arabinose efflux permease, MFS family n=1 Tax=Amycolatopsis arida TaxID=587909 RepID=A0A1I5M1D1_9PSEU|nr:putative MFS family arabinose efflux permease [Amycolatopsis arida]SFP02841.1 Predicted arabinose efflux permease, MFS family [Amycolatopsis arida]
MPVYLLGAAATVLPAEWRLDGARLGLVACAFFVSSAIVSQWGGGLADRRGARPLVLGSAAGTVLALLGVSLLTGSYWVLLGWLVLAGVANGIAQPAGNVVLGDHVPSGAHGLAFGLKVSAVPLATAGAGILVSAFGTLQQGWRYCFLAAAAPALAVLLVPRQARRHSSRDRGHPTRLARRRALFLIAAAAALGAAANTGLGTFYVSATVAGGQPAGRAALFMTVASVVGIMTRVGSGALLDRWRIPPFLAAAALLVTGLLGVLAIVARPPTGVLLVATLAAFGLGWSWQGLLAHGVAARWPGRAGAATGAFHTGLFVGAAGGPLLLGVVADHGGYGVVWLVMGGLLAAATTGVLAAEWVTRRPDHRRDCEEAPSSTTIS